MGGGYWVRVMGGRFQVSASMAVAGGTGVRANADNGGDGGGGGGGGGGGSGGGILPIAKKPKLITICSVVTSHQPAQVSSLPLPRSVLIRFSQSV